ncbi:MAG TPA: long-chain fatty acid--CoA ligase [Solirubrobacterales bacterium]|nr:long-chain fatty acid--CoA ligase [Solirubrobacterales bacterium]
MTSLGLAGGSQDFPLTLTHVLGRARTVHRRAEVVSLLDAEGTTKRARMDEVGVRADRLAAGLRTLGVGPGDRVGTYAFNSQEHLEAYYAVPCSGAVLHTLNPRLSPEQVAFTINHAGDRVILLDAVLVGEMEQVLPLLDGVERFVVIGGEGDGRGALPADTLSFEELLAAGELAADDGGFEWPELDERAAAALCYTSGTTGNPKGVLYSHRALCLHTLVMAGHDAYRMSERDRILAVVPMFHAMGWNLGYLAGAVGADLVMPGRYVQSEHLARLIAEERVTATCGVPTIWMDLLRQQGADLSSLELAICGGTQVPPALMKDFERDHGVKVVQGWGMTETLPGAALAHDPPASADDDERWFRREHAGRVTPFYEVRIVGAGDEVMPNDGETPGEVEIRGPTVIAEYFENPEATDAAMDDGWLRTGDVGTLDSEGWLRITDRAKDVIKSGGEWISSVDLESALMAHPAVVEAAVIALPDERWSERPLACVVAEAEVGPDELREFIAPRVAKWWLPDEFAYLDEIPKTSVGKFDKKLLREMLATDRLPGRLRAGAAATKGT